MNDRTHIVVGCLALDKRQHAVTLDSRRVRLTPTEFGLLWRLALEPGRVFSRELLLQDVWGGNISVEIRTVDAHMSKLRRKLRRPSDGLSVIETVWGIGYRLRDT